MCPDRQLLSVYFDGELDSPWKEKMESHLAGCPHCRGILETYRQISLHSPVLQPDIDIETAALEKAKLRVLRNLEERTSLNIPNFAYLPPQSRAGFPLRYTNIWNRRISIPLPAAAAAAILLIAFAVFWTRRPVEQTAIPNITLSSDEYSIMPADINGRQDFAPQGVVPVTSLNEVLQYLGNRDSTDILILRLPESRNFTSSGEPAIIRAADYSRRKP